MLPAVIHGMFDFSILSATVTDDAYAGSGAAILAYVIAAGLLLARRHRIEPA